MKELGAKYRSPEYNEKLKKAYEDGSKNKAHGSKSDIDKLEKDMIKLLIAEMSNSNPLQQKDSSSMMNSLTTLISLKQGVQSQHILNEILSKSDGIENYSGLLGKEILIDGDKVLMKNGGAKIHYELIDDISDPTIQIVDMKGNVVFSESVPLGTNKFIWNGVDGADEGVYDNLKFRIVASQDGDIVDAAKSKGYYTVAQEIKEEEDRGDKRRLVTTMCNRTIDLNQIKGIGLSH